ncbi:MAG: hypothetical protein KDD59_06735 [Bdellovibrionales bacterium]|nr:hypothetical protein [Bdellovibrionales bacterium]
MNLRTLTLRLGNYGFFWICAIALTAFQSALWLQLFGYTSSPYAWITVLAFWSIYRSAVEGLAMAYLLTLTVAPFTAMSLDLILFSHVFLFFCSYMLRQRIYWTGATYFMLVCGFMAMLLPFAHLVGSWVLDDAESANFLFFEWIMRTLLTTLMGLPVYSLFVWLDRFTKKPLPQEARGDLL